MTTKDSQKRRIGPLAVLAFQKTFAVKIRSYGSKRMHLRQHRWLWALLAKGPHRSPRYSARESFRIGRLRTIQVSSKSSPNVITARMPQTRIYSLRCSTLIQMCSIRSCYHSAKTKDSVRQSSVSLPSKVCRKTREHTDNSYSLRLLANLTRKTCSAKWVGLCLRRAWGFWCALFLSSIWAGCTQSRRLMKSWLR